MAVLLFEWHVVGKPHKSGFHLIITWSWLADYIGR